MAARAHPFAFYSSLCVWLRFALCFTSFEKPNQPTLVRSRRQSNDGCARDRGGLLLRLFRRPPLLREVSNHVYLRWASSTRDCTVWGRPIKRGNCSYGRSERGWKLDKKRRVWHQHASPTLPPTSHNWSCRGVLVFPTLLRTPRFLVVVVELARSPA